MKLVSSYCTTYVGPTRVCSGCMCIVLCTNQSLFIQRHLLYFPGAIEDVRLSCFWHILTPRCFEMLPGSICACAWRNPLAGSAHAARDISRISPCGGAPSFHDPTPRTHTKQHVYCAAADTCRLISWSKSSFRRAQAEVAGYSNLQEGNSADGSRRTVADRYLGCQEILSNSTS